MSLLIDISDCNQVVDTSTTHHPCWVYVGWRPSRNLIVNDAKDISSIWRYRRFGIAIRDGLPEVSR